MAGAAAIADYDQDGRMDLFLTRTYLPDLLYRQLADGTYEEVGAGAGVDWAGASNGAVWLDIDADGDLDLYVGMVGAESARLYVNDGTGLFSEEAVLRGADVAPVDASTCARTFSVMAGDADMDGDVDLFTTAWQFMDFEGNDRGRLLLNDGTGHFTDATVAAGLDTSLRAGFAGAWLDVDADGDRDLAYVADFGTSGLFMNDGAGAYTEVTATSNVGTDENGMGADWGDVDGDGDLDWFITSVYDSNPCVANWGCSGNRLFLNDGTGQFTDGTDLAGLRDGAWGWGAAMFDLDHDGDLDIAQQNGMPHDGFYEDVLRLWVNDGTGAFEDRACSHDVEYAGQGRAVIPFDHDNDGDLDLLLTFTAELPRLLRNDGADGLGAWLRVALDDPGSSNPHGIGATVRALPVYGPAWIREVHLNATFLGNGPAEAHFGLAGESAVDLEITWPDGAIQLEPSVATDQVLTVVRTVP